MKLLTVWGNLWERFTRPSQEVQEQLEDIHTLANQIVEAERRAREGMENNSGR